MDSMHVRYHRIMLLIQFVIHPLVGRSQQLGRGETTVVGGVRRPRAERGVPVAVGGAAGGGDDGGGGVRAVRGMRGVPVLLDVEREQLRGHELLLLHRLQPPGEALRHLRLHGPNLRMRRQQQLHTALLIHPSLVALRDFLIH
jgi:hypothetical protein